VVAQFENCRPSAAKAAITTMPLIAALKRCATQKQNQMQIHMQKQNKAQNQNAKSKSKSNPKSTSKIKIKSKIKCNHLGGRYRGIPPLRTKRARMGHPALEALSVKSRGGSVRLMN
ncbi:MAG: hypothetical protein WBP91_19855, partial [Terriglobales bacterium]